MLLRLLTFVLLQQSIKSYMTPFVDGISARVSHTTRLMLSSSSFHQNQKPSSLTGLNCSAPWGTHSAGAQFEARQLHCAMASLNLARSGSEAFCYYFIACRTILRSACCLIFPQYSPKHSSHFRTHFRYFFTAQYLSSTFPLIRLPYQ
ncbi:hypothetical protein F4604DRAFT_1046624 [Suillus subluteus]|nr:hypothetical protein F4604DRAFT_1046624 [Suillus subluteus]